MRPRFSLSAAIAFEAWNWVNSADPGLQFSDMVGIEVSKTVTGGLFNGESVRKDSMSGGGILMRSNELRKTVFGNECGRWWWCRRFKGDVETAALFGCLNMTEWPWMLVLPLVVRNGFARRELENDGGGCSVGEGMLSGIEGGAGEIVGTGGDIGTAVGGGGGAGSGGAAGGAAGCGAGGAAAATATAAAAAANCDAGSCSCGQSAGGEGDDNAVTFEGPSTAVEIVGGGGEQVADMLHYRCRNGRKWRRGAIGAAWNRIFGKSHAIDLVSIQLKRSYIDTCSYLLNTKYFLATSASDAQVCRLLLSESRNSRRNRDKRARASR